MPWTTHILVVANETACAPELLETLCVRSEGERTEFTLVMPVGWGDRDTVRARLQAGLRRMRARGLQIDGRLGAPDPAVAVMEVFDPGRFDEIVISTLPADVSKWLACSLPRRVERMTGIPVTHVEASRQYCERLEDEPALAMPGA